MQRAACILGIILAAVSRPVPFVAAQQPAKGTIAQHCCSIGQTEDQSQSDHGQSGQSLPVIPQVQVPPLKPPSDYQGQEIAIERQVAQYDSGLTVYTGKLARFTWWLFVATLVVAGLGAAQWHDARQTRKQLARAFLFVREAQWREWLDPTTNAFKGWCFRIQWENSGSTPTRGLRTYITGDLLDPRAVQTFDFATRAHDAVPLVIGPHASITSADYCVEREKMIAVSNGKKRLLVWGWGEYNDVFSTQPQDRHRTEFCYEWFYDGDPTTWFLARDAARVRHTIHWTHNGVDADRTKAVETPAPPRKPPLWRRLRSKLAKGGVA